MALAEPDVPVDELVATYEPDIVVEMLGFNDLFRLGHTPTHVDRDVEQLVASARSADPDVDVVLADLPQTWFDGVTELNDLLAETATQLDGVDSSVAIAHTAPGFTRSGHTYDGAHPNAQGEVVIAAAVADPLAALGVGAPAERPLPTVPVGPRIASALVGDVARGRVTLTWTRSPGARTTVVQRRDLTEGGSWVEVHQDDDLWWSATAPVGHVLQFRVLPRKGYWTAQPDVASNPVTLTVPRRPTRPRLAVTVQDGRVAVVAWRGAHRADTYAVELRRAHGHWHTVATGLTRRRLVLRELRRNAGYAVRVTATNEGGVSPVSHPVRFTLG